jgi:hypothetical protein
MADEHLEPLDAEIESLLTTERERPTASAESMARVLARVEASIATLPSGGGASAPNVAESASTVAPTTVGSALAGAVGGKLALITGAAFALGLASGASLYATLAPKPAAQVQIVEKIVEIPAKAQLEQVPPHSEPLADQPPVPESPPAPAVRSDKRAPPRSEQDELEPPINGQSSRERDRLLSEENLLIARAQAALARQDMDAAIEALELHGARFPNGQMRPERDLMLKEAHRMKKAVAP